MPRPIPVFLADYDETWPARAMREVARVEPFFGGNLVQIHHIGSTAVPGLIAKPIIDLLPEVRSTSQLDNACSGFEDADYNWFGEYGLQGRRYLTWNDPATGQRQVHLHCYKSGSPEIDRHLAFRDYLRVHPKAAEAYALEKQRARDLHPMDSHGYTEEKSAWIKKIEAKALAWRASGRSD
jgi:GrpB-like predicted nucleotidyltransferase (UPF0157 family)